MTEETLQAIEDCGAAEMPLEDVFLIAEVAEKDYWASEPAQFRYHKGQLRSKLAIRQAVIKMAKAGVPQMVKVYQDFTAENANQLPPMTATDADAATDDEFGGI